MSVDGVDVDGAVARLARVVRETPFLPGRYGALKLECLQVTGSYKVRGAYNALARQVESGDRRPVVAASAGNHAAGMAWACRRLGLDATAVVPDAAPATKVQRCRNSGCTVRRGGQSYEACEDTARRLAEERGWRFLHAFDDPDVISGQATVGIEIAGQSPEVVYVPIGGGGLASGVAMVLAPLGIQVIGVQVEGVDAMRRLLSRERGIEQLPFTVADGIRVRRAGTRTARICAEMLSDVVTVSETEVREEVVRLALEERVVAEGAGAVAAAAMAREPGARKAAVISGGNIDGAMLSELLGQRLRVA
jgi:threonine dehydratase